MKKFNQLMNKFTFVFIFAFGIGQTLSIDDNRDGSWNVNYTSEVKIAGFQFDVVGATVIVHMGGLLNLQNLV